MKIPNVDAKRNDNANNAIRALNETVRNKYNATRAATPMSTAADGITS